MPIAILSFGVPWVHGNLRPTIETKDLHLDFKCVLRYIARDDSLLCLPNAVGNWISRESVVTGGDHVILCHIAVLVGGRIQGLWVNIVANQGVGHPGCDHVSGIRHFGCL
jgi:hypothetical protein